MRTLLTMTGTAFLPEANIGMTIHEPRNLAEAVVAVAQTLLDTASTACSLLPSTWNDRPGALLACRY